MSNRVLETVTGRNAAEKEITSMASVFNDCNGKGRMIPKKNALEVHDNEGSGEFYQAVCVKYGEESDGSRDVYEIQTCW